MKNKKITLMVMASLFSISVFAMAPASDRPAGMSYWQWVWNSITSIF